jgi:hypothetical protein
MNSTTIIEEKLQFMLETIDISQEQIQQFHDQGFFILDPQFTPGELNGVKSEFHRLWDEELLKKSNLNKTEEEFMQVRPFIGHVHSRSDLCAHFCQSLIFQEITRKLIGPDVDLYYNQAVMKPPSKGKAFGWHQDSQYIITKPLEYVTCWVAIGDTTVENGTIWIVPGMHKSGLLPHQWSEEHREFQLEFDDSARIPVELSAGQIAVFHSLLPHCSGPNTSNAIRYAYVVQYHHAQVPGEDGQLKGDQWPLLRNGEFVDSSEVSRVAV